MRIYPVVAVGTLRCCSHDAELVGGRYDVPAGTMLWMPFHAIHNTSANWDDVKTFTPVRRPRGVCTPHLHRAIMAVWLDAIVQHCSPCKRFSGGGSCQVRCNIVDELRIKP
jgi:cytochrome P450